MSEAYALRGVCNYANKKLLEARQDFMRAEDLAPNLRNQNDIASIKLSLSTLELDLGNSVDAEQYARESIRLGLNTSASANQLGATLAAQKRFEESIEAFNKAIELNPNDPQLWVNKGSSYFYLRDMEQAHNCFQEALKINPEFVPALKNLASYYFREAKEFVLAQEILEKADKLLPGDVQILTSLAIAYQNTGKLSQARTAIELALEKEPNNADVVATLLGILVKIRDLSSARKLVDRILVEPGLECLVLKTLPVLEQSCEFGKRVEVLNRMRDMRSLTDKETAHLPSALLSLDYTNTVPSSDVLRLHLLAGEYITNLSSKSEYSHNIATFNSNSKLRIGYVSADFRDHSVGYFIRNIINSHDPDKFEIYCYADLETTDAITDEISKQAFRFRDITKLNEEKVAKLINNDRIQILVDLGGYTGTYRIPVFAYKPAPIQMTYLGYPNTTGLGAIDYRITDAYAEHPDGTMYSEELIRMPESFLCFGNFSKQDIHPAPPIEKNGFITFGSFNHVGKLTEEAISVWSEILRRKPDSVILFKHWAVADETTRENILTEFEKNLIERGRIRFNNYLEKKTSHLEFYNNIDIALDTFPYNGTTTTCEALWMGVPVVTLVGKKHAQRVSFSILSNIGHAELAAKSEKEYIETACELASDPDRLRTLRSGMRSDLSKSILCNPEKFTMQLEDIYLNVWNRYLGN